MHRNREYNTKTKILDVPFDLIIFLGIMASTSKNYKLEMSLEEEYIYIMFHISR